MSSSRDLPGRRDSQALYRTLAVLGRDEAVEDDAIGDLGGGLQRLGPVTPR